MSAGWGCAGGDCEEEKSKGLLIETRPEMEESEMTAMSCTGQVQAYRNGGLGLQEKGRKVV